MLDEIISISLEDELTMTLGFANEDSVDLVVPSIRGIRVLVVGVNTCVGILTLDDAQFRVERPNPR